MCCDPDDQPTENNNSFNGSDAEANALNNVVGAALKVILSRNQFCSEKCKEQVIQATSTGRVEEIFIGHQNIGRLIYPTQQAYELMKVVESETLYHLQHCFNHTHLLQHIQEKIHLKIESPILCSPECSIFPSLIEQYVRIRLNIHSTQIKEKAKADRKKSYGSRSAANISISHAGSGLWEVNFRP